MQEKHSHIAQAKQLKFRLQSYVLSFIQEDVPHAPVLNGAPSFVVAAVTAKRGIAVEYKSSSLVKCVLVVDIWKDSNRRGRHEGLYTDGKP
jgi:hypothetical protein